MAKTKTTARKSASSAGTTKVVKKDEKIDVDERSDDAEEEIENEENGVESKEVEKNGHVNGVSKPDLLANGNGTPKSRGRPKKAPKEEDENDNETEQHLNGKSETNGHENGTEAKSTPTTNGNLSTPKSRGRPKKVIKEDDKNGQENEPEVMDTENSNVKTSETKEEQKNSQENGTDSATAPKSRGRPKKEVKPEEDNVKVDEQEQKNPTTPKSRGRPKKVVTAEDEANGEDNEAEKKSDSLKNGKNTKGRAKKAASAVVDLDDKSDAEEDEDEDSEENEPQEKEANGHDNETQTKSGLLTECQKLFGTSDLYSVLNLKKTCEAAEIKKAYYKFSLKYHPDKSDESQKDEHKVKFQLLCQVYSILSDDEKRKIYDECGVIDGENDLITSDKDWSEYWRTMFKKITKEDVDKFFEEYRQSNEERTDLLSLYEKHKGDMDLITQEFFSQDLLEDEPRIRKIISDAIEKGDATSYDIFTNESKRKASKRKAMLQSEAKEAEQMRKKMGIDDSEESLKALIHNRQKQREADFLNHLTEKYGKKQAKKPSKAAKRATESDEESEENESSNEDEDYDTTAKRKKIPRAAPSGKKTKKIKRL